MKYYLGLDNGGTVTKAALYTSNGEEVAVASKETKMISVAQGFTERDMLEMKQANFDVIKKLLDKTKVKPGEIHGVACCGHGKGLYLWGKDNQPVRPGIISTDNRAWEYPLKWLADGTANKAYKKTYQAILACQPVSLLAWMKDHEPETIEQIQWVFECKDYVRFCLTGEAYAEITDYSGANLINLETRDYDESLLALFGLSELYACLPPIRTSLDICGKITDEVAGLTGLKAGTPVFGGMFDINACALAVDAVYEDKICMIAGTWSINEYIRKTPVLDGSVMMNSIFCLPEYYLIEESSPTSAGNNEWFIKTLLPELKEKAEAEGKSIYEITNAWVKEIPIEAVCPIFMPFLMASNVHPSAKACFIGMSNYHTRGHLVKSIYEGIAFSHRYHLEKLLKAKETPVTSIRLAGGVARSAEWVQIFADVMGYPIEVADINETGTLGCAMNVAVGLGDYTDFQQAAAQMISMRKAVLPKARNQAIYQERYKMYCRMIEALDPVWGDLQVMISD